MADDILDLARSNVPLAPRTTLGVGGPAALYLEVGDSRELAAAVTAADRKNLPLLILGGGSNMVISDDGFDGLVIRNLIDGISVDEGGTVRAGAGVNWDRLVAETVDRQLGGFECLSGIPGDVGATPIQNVGAYGQEVGDTLVAVEAFDRSSQSFVTLSREACELSYRDSRFKSRERDRFVITAVEFKLEPNGKPTIHYPDLRRQIEAIHEGDPPLEVVRDSVLRIRRSKGMVIDPSDPDSRSAGSFFTNPVLSAAAHEQFIERAKSLGLSDEPRTFETDDGFKLSAAWLIDHSGFNKGDLHRSGNVGLSSKHVLAIVNRGGGTAAEIRELAGEIQAGVERTFDVRIEPEPNFIGNHRP